MSLEYVNGFGSVIKEDKSEMIITFFRNYPELSLGGQLGENITETVGSVVMSYETAKGLLSTMSELLKKVEENDD